jgi:methyltransferase family protein
MDGEEMAIQLAQVAVNRSGVTSTAKSPSGLIAIRPHHIFAALETKSVKERACTMLIPHPSSFSGGVLTVEALLLIALVKISDANRLFEFGTYMGGTTVLLAENCDDSATLFTLDLPLDASGASQVAVDSAFGDTTHHDEDAFVAAKAVAHGPVVAEGFYGQSPSKKIKFLYADSKTVDLSAYDRSMDMVWVDGGHDYETVRIDTENAFKMANPRNKNAVIVWHDFDNKAHPDVGTYLRELAQEQMIYTIGSTMLAVCFPNTDSKRFG